MPTEDTTTRIAELEAGYQLLGARVRSMEDRHFRGLAASEALLRDWAATINGWADDSLSGGWSTHQVEKNRRLASQIHAAADDIHRHLKLAEWVGALPKAEPEKEGGAK